MAGELDLERGEPGADEAPKPRGQSERSGRRHRADIRDRLTVIFERLADSLEGRGDEELAGMIREDTKAMVGGLLSVTRRAPALAAPILGALAVLEPLIAFGRIFRLLLRRMGDRRREALQGFDAEPVYGPEEPPPAEPGAARLADEPVVAEPWRLDN